MQRIEPETKIEIIGITREDIQDVFEQTLKNFKESKTRVIYLDASYLYNFELDDFEYVRKLNLLTRYHPEQAIQWHKLLERWYNDQTVRDNNGYQIKPIQISRTFDRVVNEGMEAIAINLIGGDTPSFKYRSIGMGVVPEALPGDMILANEINRINVLENIEGGSLSRDGSTIYSIGNHPKTVQTASVTECGMQSAKTPANDRMFDHSVFPTPISHVANADAVGSTTVVYMCSA